MGGIHTSGSMTLSSSSAGSFPRWTSESVLAVLPLFPPWWSAFRTKVESRASHSWLSSEGPTGDSSGAALWELTFAPCFFGSASPLLGFFWKPFFPFPCL